MKNIKKTEQLVPEFLYLPYQLVIDKELAPIDRIVYGAVYFFSKLRGERCYATNSTIASLIGSTRNTVSKSLQKLEKRKYILMTYEDPDTKKFRSEIVPLVRIAQVKISGTNIGKNRTLKSEPTVIPNGITFSEKTAKNGLAQMDIPVSSNGITGYSKQDNPKKALKIGVKKTETIDNKDFSEEKKEGGVIPNGYVRENIERIVESKIKRELFFDHSGQEHLGGEKEEKPLVKIQDTNGKLINDAIALFLVILPGDFIGTRTAFAKPPTREAVSALLKRYSLDQVKELIQKYDSGKTDPYRPNVGTVYEFCTTKLGKVEAYVAKSAGGLWAQKSISTPEQRASSDDLIKKKIEATREKQRKNREEWEMNNPKTI